MLVSYQEQVVNSSSESALRFLLVVAFCRPIVSVVYGEDRVSGGIETVEGGKKRVRGWGLVDCVSGTVLSESGKAGRESRAVVSRRWWLKDGLFYLCLMDEERPDHPTREVYQRKAVG